MIIGYIRVSTDKQDLEKQRYLLLEYANKHELIINEFIEVEISSKDTKTNRKIDDIFEKLSRDDILIVAELSRLGRNMLQTLNIINELTEAGIKIIFVRQPELSTTSSHTKLLLAIYSYFAESERDYISIRTKQGLAAAKAKGKILGRPKGSKNKKGRRLDPVKGEIEMFLKLKIPVNSILKLINKTLEPKISYNTLKYYIDNDISLQQLKKRSHDNISKA